MPYSHCHYSPNGQKIKDIALNYEVNSKVPEFKSFRLYIPPSGVNDTYLHFFVLKDFQRLGVLHYEKVRYSLIFRQSCN